MEKAFNCVICGKEFIANSRGQTPKYCGFECRHKAEAAQMREYRKIHPREPQKKKAKKNKKNTISWIERFEAGDKLSQASMLVPELHKIKPFINSYGDLQVFAFFHGSEYKQLVNQIIKKHRRLED